jgi:phage anti-repressor protein
MENGILVEKKDLIPELEEQLMLRRKNSSKWTPHNIAEYFFFDEFGFLTITDKKILECYSDYTGVIDNVYT